MNRARMMLLIEREVGLTSNGMKFPLEPARCGKIKPPMWSNKDSHFIDLASYERLKLDTLRPVLAQRFQIQDKNLAVYNEDGREIDEVQAGENYYVAGYFDWGRGCPRVTAGQVDFAEGK